MDQCGHCGKRIAFGGVRDGEFRYCDAECFANGLDERARHELPPQEVMDLAMAMRLAPCPQCGKHRPVDYYQSWRIYSYALWEETSANNHFICRRCARFKQFGNGLFCLLFGWWSYLGLLLTPVYLFRNLMAFFRADPGMPSERLLQRARLRMAGMEFEHLEPDLVQHSFRPEKSIGIGGWILILLLVGFLIFVIYLQNTGG